jgi:hypothetical protein
MTTEGERWPADGRATARFEQQIDDTVKDAILRARA